MTDRETLLEKILEELRGKLGRRAVPYGIVLVEEFARELAESMPKPEFPRTATRKIELINRIVRNRLDVADIKGKGKIREYVIVSDKPSYTVELVVDSIPKLPEHRSIEDLIKVSPFLEYLDVVQSNGEYVLRVSDLNFIEGFKSTIYPLEEVKFSRILVLYDIIT